ncbi:hypothetical protein GPECTOR_81g224 [Gonium pectorale]|uniref:C2 domain-containing protein n=1 Tax=Gonium pectorale TaxID=33097 RepID=A0A150G1S8_GONPE|nr:hypothetical protein GPECTOR_81g224 [Gonium pectorale]|eukprot:KXZ43774.1 hypothetical protein GPECTOR_81g224 [Gonium pectorale]
MADDNIKVINAGDLLKGIKLNFNGQAAQDLVASASQRAHSKGGASPAGGPGPGPPPAASPAARLLSSPCVLDEVGSCLAEQYAVSEWLVPPGQPNDWRFMTAVVRSVVSEALALNTAVASQLALQAAALAGGGFAVGRGSFPPEPQAARAYEDWRREALLESRQLLTQQASLPPFNGLLRIEVLGAAGLRGPRGKSSPLRPYVVAWLVGPSGSRKSDKHATRVASEPDRPRWEEQLEPLQVGAPDWELLVQVHSAQDPGRPSRSDPVLGRGGLLLAGLVPGRSTAVELRLFGGREAKGGGGGAGGGGGKGVAGGGGGGKGGGKAGGKKGGGGGGGFLCGCFGGGGGGVREPEEPEEPEEAPPLQPAAAAAAWAAQGGGGGGGGGSPGVAGRAGSVEQLDDLEGARVVFDPATATTSGAAGREERGVLSIRLRYLPE